MYIDDACDIDLTAKKFADRVSVATNKEAEEQVAGEHGCDQQEPDRAHVGRNPRVGSETMDVRATTRAAETVAASV